MNKMHHYTLTLLCYVQIFASVFCAIILTFIPSLMTYKEFVIGVGVISLSVSFFTFLKYFRARSGIIYTLLIGTFLLLYYYLTGISYTISSAKYDSFFMVLYGQSIPTMLIASSVSMNPYAQLLFKRSIPYVAIVFSFVSFISAFFPTDMTSGGYASNENGLNYQSTSYMSAYASGLILYYIIFFKHIDWLRPFRNRYIRMIMSTMLIINFLTILIAGGRGGLVLYVILLFFIFIFHVHRSKFSLSQVFKYLVLGLFLLILVYLSICFVRESTVETSGFERILAFVQEHDQNGRDELREIAWASFWGAPLCGHGIGSVFFEIGEYSHNCFTDVLVETGCFGCVVFLTMLLCVAKKLYRFIKIDVTDMCWAIIFLDGFVLSLFSGYYLANMPLIWIISFIFCIKKQKLFRQLKMLNN